ncbi:MAG: glycosyl hydrolase [Luteolibacter sp.]
MKLATLAPLAALFLPSFAIAAPTDWPVAAREVKPWIQWPSWTTLTEAQITEASQLVHQSGFGGIVLRQQKSAEKTPAYLGTDWLAQLSKISKTATAQELGIDLAEFSFSDWQLASTLAAIDQEIEGGNPVQIKFPAGKLEALRAYSAEGKSVNLSPLVKKARLTWKAPAGKWRVLGLFSNTQTGKNTLDPFSTLATKAALKRFDQAFGKNTPTLRARFHPAFDPQTPVWSAGLLEAFTAKRGYDLRAQLPAFFGIGEADAIARVRADYRQTLDELYLAHLQAWQDAAAKKKTLTRLQTQDAIGNIIDQAAITDIPEIIATTSITAEQFPQLLLAPSGAHLTGKPLVAASVSAKDLQLKQTADLLWLAGVNHLILDEAPAPLFNGYISRVQSFLQSGKSSAQLLVYYPDADLWHQPTAEGSSFAKSSIHQLTTALNKAGIGFELISDQLLATATVKDGRIVLKDRAYKALILPQIRVLPEATAKRLRDLTKSGAKLGLTGDLPSQVPGFSNLGKRTAAFTKLLAEIPAEARVTDANPVTLAYTLGVSADPLTETGIRLIRRDLEDGSVYFLVNATPQRIDVWQPIGVPFSSAVFFDPLNSDRSGLAPARNILGNPNIHLVLAPGESRILRTYTAPLTEGKNWQD